MPEPSRPIEQEQARQQTGQQQVRLRVENRGAPFTYANMFGANASADELVLDFGTNQAVPGAKPEDPPEILFTVSQRIVMNLYSAKRLALTLSQLIRRHEEQFGLLELDVAKRRKTGG
jgi:hypothetical protein